MCELTMAVPMANLATNGRARRYHRRNTRRAHADRSLPKNGPPRPLQLPVPASHAHPHAYRTPRPVCDCHCVPSSLIKSRIKTDAPHQLSLSSRRMCMGFPPVPVHHAPSISARGRWGRPGRRDGYASCASHTCECSWPEGSPPYVVALRMSAMAEGWGEDEIKPGIAH